MKFTSSASVAELLVLAVVAALAVLTTSALGSTLSVSARAELDAQARQVFRNNLRNVVAARSSARASDVTSEDADIGLKLGDQDVEAAKAARTYTTTVDSKIAAEVDEPLRFRCSACAAFLPEIEKLVRANNVQLPYGAGDDAIKAKNRANEALCAQMGTEEHRHACTLIATMYGLENVEEFSVAASDLLCEPLAACDKKELVVHDQVAANQLDDASDILVAAAGKGAASVGDMQTMGDMQNIGAANPMAQVMQHRLFAMLNMKLMQDSAMGEQLVHNMMTKLVAAQVRFASLRIHGTRLTNYRTSSPSRRSATAVRPDVWGRRQTLPHC